MKVRHSHRATALAALFLLALAFPAAAQEPGDDAANNDPDLPQVSFDELTVAPTPVAPAIQASRMDGEPASGKGRMTFEFEGNRRWCTFPDDRVVKPPPGLTNKGASQSRNPVYTFGYQFTVAAVERSRPWETRLLFESPVFRTAVYRQAAKVGKGRPKPQAGPTILEPTDQVEVKTGQIDPTSFIPFWQEQYRCTTLPEAIDVDLEPGIYDVYMAFDILLRSGNWAHRSIGFGTDIAVEPGRLTRVQARANMSAGARRDLEIMGATIVDASKPADRP